MKQKHKDSGSTDQGSTPASGDGVLQELANKAAALAPALAPALETSSDGDARRRGEIKVHKLSDQRYKFQIDGVTWAEIDWHLGRKMWCIQDALGHCLSHVSHQLLDIPNDGMPGDHITKGVHLDPTTAIEKTKQMIRDGSMPTPEQAETAERSSKDMTAFRTKYRQYKK